mgnify:FL=1|tara:strand:- start:857 stop:1405 length:549 start_codon:yes stop_codon:yes gene_type:complete
MNLRLHIPGKIWWINNFLDYSTYKTIHDSIIKDRNKIKLHSTENDWHKFLYENIQPPLKSDIMLNKPLTYKPFQKLLTLVKHNPFFKPDDVKKNNFVIHYMKKGAGINWHDDNNWKYGITYYVNKRWNRQWGGELMFSHEEGSGYIPIIGNSLLIVRSPIQHKVVPVVTDVMPRISVQIFMR